MAAIAAGTGSAQLVALLSLPLLTRLYSKEQFGLFGSVMAIASLGAPLLHGRLHLAAIGQREVEIQERLFSAAVASVLLIGPIYVSLAFIVTGLFTSETGSSWIVVLAIANTIALSVSEVFASLRSVRGEQIRSAVALGVRSSTTALFQLALSKLLGIGLLVGAVSGSIVSVLAGWSPSVRRLAALRFAARDLLEIAIKFRHFALLGVPQGLLASVGWNLLPFLVGLVSGVGAVGSYWLAYRIVLAPLVLANSSYRQGVGAVVVALGPTEAHRAIRRHTVGFAMVGAACSLMLISFGEPLFGWLLGAEWKAAGSFAAMLSPVLIADSAKIPVQYHSTVQGRNAELLRAEVAVFIVRMIGATALFLWGNARLGLLAFALLGLVGWAAFIVRELAVIKRSELTGIQFLK